MAKQIKGKHTKNVPYGLRISDFNTSPLNTREMRNKTSAVKPIQFIYIK
jgi:hypothetical protein